MLVKSTPKWLLYFSGFVVVTVSLSILLVPYPLLSLSLFCSYLIKMFKNVSLQSRRPWAAFPVSSCTSSLYVSLAWVQIFMYTSSSPWRYLILQFISQTTCRSDRYWKSYLLRRLFPVSWTIIYSEFSRVLSRLLTELDFYQHSPHMLPHG